MNILIVDDEPLARDRLRSLINELQAGVVVGEAGNGLEAIQRYEQLQPEVLLLDIRMPGMDGMETALHLAGLEQPPAVIFTTAYGDHALQAFEAHAVDYLVKPIRKERLQQALQRAQALNRPKLVPALNQAQPRARTHISVHRQGKILLVPVADILYFHADQKYVTVHHQNGEVLIEESLKQLEQEFHDQFLRIHRNALVAYRSIAGMEKDASGHYQLLVRSSDQRLEISRRHWAQVKAFLIAKK